MQFWARGRPQTANLGAPGRQNAERNSECNSGGAGAQEREVAHRLQNWVRLGTRTPKEHKM
eukprot:9365812-Pyramimonas_sp.AAC.1